MRSSAARGHQVAVLRAVRLPIGTAPRRTDRPSWITLTRQIPVSGTYRIAEVVFSDADTVRELIHNFNRDGFEALYPRYRGGRPRTFTLSQRQAIKRIALALPTDLGQPFATWSLAKLAD
jgi:Homeodomain-like domain